MAGPGGAPTTPVVLRSAVSHWPAIRKWDPERGGLAYLRDTAGDARVQLMLTRHVALLEKESAGAKAVARCYQKWPSRCYCHGQFMSVGQETREARATRRMDFGKRVSPPSRDAHNWEGGPQQGSAQPALEWVGLFYGALGQHERVEAPLSLACTVAHLFSLGREREGEEGPGWKGGDRSLSGLPEGTEKHIGDKRLLHAFSLKECKAAVEWVQSLSYGGEGGEEADMHGSKECATTRSMEKLAEGASDQKQTDIIRGFYHNLPANIALYLAQNAIQETAGTPSPVSALLSDCLVPPFVTSSSLSSVNLWMTLTGATASSAHYDPFQNALCVVAGRKTVSLWPPDKGPSLHPCPIYSEASNHIRNDFYGCREHSLSHHNAQTSQASSPSFETAPHPVAIQDRQFQDSLNRAWTVILNPGDALIPEGWYHQVSSVPGTLAVNFWWPSTFARTCLGSHIEMLYARQLLASLVEKQMRWEVERLRVGLEQQTKREACSTGGVPMKVPQHLNRMGKIVDDSSSPESEGSSERLCSPKHAPHGRMGTPQRKVVVCLWPLGPGSTLQRWRALRRRRKMGVRGGLAKRRYGTHSDKTSRRGAVKSQALVEEVRAPPGEPEAPQPFSSLSALEKKALASLVQSAPSPAEAVAGDPEGDRREDHVAGTLLSLAPQSLAKVLKAMSEAFPWALRQLLLHGLSPVAAHILTTKLEELELKQTLEGNVEESEQEKNDMTDVVQTPSKTSHDRFIEQKPSIQLGSLLKGVGSPDEILAALVNSRQAFSLSSCSTIAGILFQ